MQSNLGTSQFKILIVKNDKKTVFNKYNILRPKTAEVTLI